MKNKKQEKKKILISLDFDTYQILEKETKEQGIGKSQLIQKLIIDNVENRLSKYITRNIENLLLYLILQNKEIKKLDKNELIEKMDQVFRETKKVQTIKSIFLKEQREKKREEVKNFWNQILNLLEPKNFVNKISINGKVDVKKTKNFIKELYQLIKENKKLWEK